MKEKIKTWRIYQWLRQLERHNLMLRGYWRDFSLCRKYNFGNIDQKSINAFRGKILRQTHMIEKGMSLSHPRKGFGVEKIKILLRYIDEYIRLGYDKNDICILNAVNTLEEYISFQRNMGVTNNELMDLINEYEVTIPKAFKSGIVSVTKEEILKDVEMKFPEFFVSRHSVRQFSNEPINDCKIQKAVQLAMKSPSACNRQPAKVYYFKNEDVNKEIGRLIKGNTGFEDETPNYLIITSDRSCYTESYERNQPYVDGSLFAMGLIMSLHYYGIASCCLQACETTPLEKAMKKVTNIPENEVIVLFLAVGNYKDEFSVAVSARKNIEDVLIIDK